MPFHGAQRTSSVEENIVNDIHEQSDDSNNKRICRVVQRGRNSVVVHEALQLSCNSWRELER